MEIIEIASLTEAEVPTRGRPKGSTTVDKIREVHHFVARMVAKGHKPAEIARVINRSAPTVRNMLANPAMADLVAGYQDEHFAEAENELDYRTELEKQISVLGLERIRDKLADPECDMPIAQVIKAVDSANDRTGLGKQETRVNLNVDLGAKLDRATKAKRGLDAARAVGNVVDFIRRE